MLPAIFKSSQKRPSLITQWVSMASSADAAFEHATESELAQADQNVEFVRPVIGGQAIIEGVMMRSPHSFAVAVRKPDGKIVVREQQWLSFSKRFSFLRWPILRGANMLIESMFNGMNALNFSADQALSEDEKEGDAQKGDGVEKKSNLGLFMTVAFSMIMAVTIFKGVPHLLTWGLGEWMGKGDGNALPVTGPIFHLVDGGIRLSIFVLYIFAISRMNDVKRLFMYHGAEHKSVHSYEGELELNVANTQPQSTAHPRCGTSLILLVISVSVVVFAAIIPLLPVVSDNSLIQTLFAFLVKVPLLLPVAGIAYEAQRLAAKHPTNGLVRAMIAPGMLMQKLTTREPDDDQVEVALTALRKAVWREAKAQKDANDTVRGEAQIEVFNDFAGVTQQVAA